MAIFDPTGARATVPTGPTGISIPTRTALAPNAITPTRTIPARVPARLTNASRSFNRGGLARSWR